MHVVALCETFLKPETLNTVDLENYQAIHQCRAVKAGGGTSLLIHDNIQKWNEIQTFSNESFESVSAEITFNGTPILVSEFYHAPNTNDLQFAEGLDKLLRTTSDYKHSVICSDQNLDLLRSGQHKNTDSFLQTMLNNKFIPYIVKPMRVTHRSSMLIDNIYVKTNVIKKNYSYVIVDPMSDHYPCFLSSPFGCTGVVGSDTIIEKRKFTDEAILGIQQFLLFPN